MRNVTRKALGAFYTDPRVADFLVAWAVRSPGDVVMDPSFGDGVFLRAACERILGLGGQAPLQVFGVEPNEAEHARVLGHLRSGFGLTERNLLHADFFDIGPLFVSPRITCMVGNPPFIRYHRFNGRSRAKALQCAWAAGVALSELSSSWAPFLVHATSLLADGGRMGMVVPAELCHAAYGLPVLEHLGKSFERITFVTFDTRLFPDLNQETMLLLADGRGHRLRGMEWRNVPAARWLHADGSIPEGKALPRVDHEALTTGRSRLLEYMIPPRAAALWRTLRESPSVKPLGDIADVGIGYVTGSNSFFHLTPESVRELGIPGEFLRKAVKRGRSLKGLRYTAQDWETGLAPSEACWLLHIPGAVSRDRLPDPVLHYVERGEASGIHLGYKCRNREPWYSVPYVEVPGAFLSYMSGGSPRLVTNEAGAVAPNSLHLVRVRADRPGAVRGAGTHPGNHTTVTVPVALLPVAWLTSLTALSCELEGHSLGGGLLKLEPGEAERVSVPVSQSLCEASTDALKSLAEELDRLSRQGRVETAWRIADRTVLIEGLGLSQADCLILRQAADALTCRRRER